MNGPAFARADKVELLGAIPESPALCEGMLGTIVVGDGVRALEPWALVTVYFGALDGCWRVQRRFLRPWRGVPVL